MEKIKIMGILIFAAIMIAACSKVIPAPEVEIICWEPADFNLDTTMTITFKNMNHVDAILTRGKYDMKGSSTYTYLHYISTYIPAGDSVEFVLSWGNLNYFRTLVGDSAGTRKMTLTFTGTDAYGYNKKFTVRPFTVSF